MPATRRGHGYTCQNDAAVTDSRSWATDVACACALVLLVSLYVTAAIDLSRLPEEDAAMLLRYSGHLADGHGIVWNAGEPPVDGATDLLFMVLVAAVHKTGIGLERAAQAVGLLAHVATVLLVFFSARRQLGAPAALALLSAVFLALGPGLRHLAACYGTPLFALACALTFVSALRLADAPSERVAQAALAFSLAGLFAGLARPEGVFFAVFCLGAVLHARRGEATRLILGRFLAVFSTLGLGYFLWRFWYFGYPLPNPFYKKGAGLLYWHSLRQSWRNLFSLGLPFVAVLLLGPFFRATRRVAVLTLIPVVAFVCLFVLISDETNYVMRFRYPVLPAILIGGVAVWQGAVAPRLARWPQAVTATTLVVATLGLALFQHQRFQHVEPRRMGLYDAALVLRDYDRYNYALVTTEAGLLPLYSTWRAVDAWGLNDRYVAHNGAITEEYLDRYRPEVILFHAYFSPGTPETGPRIENRSLGRPWYTMVMTLKGYAERNGYVLAAVFGRNAYDTHYYYVRSGFARSREISDRIRALDYQWDGEATTDFAASHQGH
jgi:arabinofuranosyltransferase